MKPSEKRTKKFFNDMSSISVYCKCGHSVQIYSKTDRLLCTWCGKWVYKNPQIEFKYKLQEKMKKK